MQSLHEDVWKLSDDQIIYFDHCTFITPLTLTYPHTHHCRVKAVQKQEKEHQRHIVAQHSLPSYPTQPSSSSTLPSQRGGALHALQEKVMQGMMSKSLPTPSAPPTSSTGPSTQPSRSAGFVAKPVRKARSETDLRESDLEKSVKVSDTYTYALGAM